MLTKIKELITLIQEWLYLKITLPRKARKIIKKHYGLFEELKKL